MDQEPQKNLEQKEAKISPVVSIENGDKKTQITIQNIDSLFQDIKTYNDQFSLGHSLFSVINNLIKTSEEEDAISEVNGPKPSWMRGIDEESQHMSASVVNVNNETTLKALGLSLEPVSGKSVNIFGPEGHTGTGEMRINISDRSQLGTFLKALEPNQVEETPLRKNLGSLTNILSQQILDEYNLNQPNDETLAALGSLDTIVKEYNRLGLTDEARPMEEYLQHAREGNLREFVALKTSGFMQEPGKGFGPADWQKDASDEFLRRKWGQAIQLLRTLRNNPRSSEMYKKLLTHLNNSVSIARTNIQELDYYTPEGKQRLDAELAIAQEDLKAFEA